MDPGGNPPSANSRPASARWLAAWPDALAGAAALALAWCLHWQVRDLVWSLWLSSLLVGYAMIVWRIFGPLVIMSRKTDAGRVAALYWIGGLFLLAFFTFHFGMFHFVHSVFLNLFFPVFAGGGRGFPSAALYLEVLRSYWPFVFVAALAERAAFQRPAALLVGPGAASAGKGKAAPDGMMEPYKNVVRMHCLIFFFAFAHFARLESFFVYAVVYAVYFFPWRLLRRHQAETAATAT
jgi:hypothetical protein